MIQNFINLFDSSRDLFLNGMCYYFAVILKERFGGKIYYSLSDNHFVTKIGDGLYDASGDVTYYYPKTVAWDEYIEIDPIHADRIIRDCIMKEDCISYEEAC